MTTTGITLDPKNSMRHNYWEDTGMHAHGSASEDLIQDSNGNKLVFNMDVYEGLSICLTNTDNSNNVTVKPFVSNAADPGTVFGTHFGADSKWVQAKDSDGADISITVTSGGTPANNEFYDMTAETRWVAFSCLSAAAVGHDSINMSLAFKKKRR